MFCRFRRPQHDVFLALFLNQRREFFALVRSHMARTAMRALVVAYARPFVGPATFATRAFVKFPIPGHANLLKIANDNFPERRNQQTRDHANTEAADEFLV